MTKARARTTAKKVKDKWRSKNWYQILAPTLFNSVPVAETLSDSQENLLGRVTEVSMQDLTSDFRKSHIKLFFKIDRLEGNNAYTNYNGHMLTSDYLRRMIRRRKSRIDGVYDVETRDGAYLTVKPFAITEKRIQHSQKRLIRNVMKETIAQQGKVKTFNEFLRDTLDGKLGSEIYKHCKIYYPVKRIEIYKTDVERLPTIIIEDTPPAEPQTEEIKEQPPVEQKPEEAIIEKPTEEIVSTTDNQLEVPSEIQAPQPPAEQAPEEVDSEVPKDEPKKAKKPVKAKKEKKELTKTPKKKADKKAKKETEE